MEETSKEDKIKSEILKAALLIFQQYGLTKTTMEDIARAAGKGKSTLYYYYKSKDEVFKEVVIEQMQELFNLVREKVNECESSTDKLKMFISTTFNEMRNKMVLYKTVTMDISKNFSIIFDLRKLFLTEERNDLQRIIELGVRNGEFKSMTKKEASILSYIIISATRSLELDLFLDNMINDTELKLGSMMDLLINGLKK
ncbi:MAG: TetR/AcrR family transcriptional regulator [Bacteroidota bacterium]|nr:TetR/AcrR family transcriptional regulator [Bacteroidota bacterium]